MDMAAFQSLAQLAVAANLAFTAVAAFAGNAVEREKDRIDLLFETAKDITDVLKERDYKDTDQVFSSLHSILALRQEASLAEQKKRWYFDDFAKWIALAMAILAFLTLVVLSFEVTVIFGYSLTPLVPWVVVGVNVPLLVAVAAAAVLTSADVRRLRGKRIKLDEDLSNSYTKLITG